MRDKKNPSHPDIAQLTTELGQVEKERADLKRQFLAWLREGNENSYNVPLQNKLPQFLIRARARYTNTARNNRVTGIVKLSMIFHNHGDIAEIRVVDRLPDGLIENAIYAAKENIFIPSTNNGKFTTVTGQIEYSFNLY